MSFKEKNELPLIARIVIQSPTLGLHGNKIPLTTNDGRTLCCMAQRGECRHNSRHYEGGMRSEHSWSLPQVEPGCDRRCGYRVEVADPKTDQEYTTRLREYDPNGFMYYKRPSDACQYQPAPGESYRHDARTCPQCSQPQVTATDDWVDVHLVAMYTEHEDPMGLMVKEGYDPTQELSTTPGTKAAIRSRLLDKVIEPDEE